MAEVGQRVELVETNDGYTVLSPGERGTVSFIDDMGTVFVDWDDGSRLGLIEEAGDRWKVLERCDHDGWQAGCQWCEDQQKLALRAMGE